MTAIKPTNSVLRDKIDSDGYNTTLNVINSKYAEMDKFIENLQSDITAVKDFEKDVLTDKARGYDVGTSLDTLQFQSSSLTIDLNFFTHMKIVYIKKLYGDLYKYCDNIIFDTNKSLKRYGSNSKNIRETLNYILKRDK